METEGLFLDYQGQAGIISIVRWNLRPVIFGVDFKHQKFQKGVGARKSFICQIFRPLLFPLFPMPPWAKGDTFLGNVFWLFLGVCLSPTPSRQPLFETSENKAWATLGHKRQKKTKKIGRLGSFSVGGGRKFTPCKNTEIQHLRS